LSKYQLNSIFKVIGLTVLYYLILNGITYVLFTNVPIEFLDTNDKIYLLELIPLTIVLLITIIVYKLLIKRKLNKKSSFLSLRPFIIIIVLAFLLRFIRDPIYRFDEIFFSGLGNLSSEYLKAPHIKEQLFLIFNTLFLGPVLEELMFRGIVLRTLIEKKINIALSIFISSLLFALIHLNYINFDFTSVTASFVSGVLIGIVYLRYGLFYSIFFHICINAVWFILNQNRELYWSVIKKLDFGILYWLLILTPFLIIVFVSKRMIDGYTGKISK
jgi:membrane protease YdiL (CAAX protease family)